MVTVLRVTVLQVTGLMVPVLRVTVRLPEYETEMKVIGNCKLETTNELPRLSAKLVISTIQSIYKFAIRTNFVGNKC